MTAFRQVVECGDRIAQLAVVEVEAACLVDQGRADPEAVCTQMAVVECVLREEHEGLRLRTRGQCGGRARFPFRENDPAGTRRFMLAQHAVARRAHMRHRTLDGVVRGPVDINLR